GRDFERRLGGVSVARFGVRARRRSCNQRACDAKPAVSRRAGTRWSHSSEESRLRFPMQLNTYLNYGGNCEQAFRFYEQHLGGKITMMMTHGQAPSATDVAPEWRNAILHARMNLGETELMGADVPPERFQPMRSGYVSLLVSSI